MFKLNISWHKKFWGAQKYWGELLSNSPRGNGPADKLTSMMSGPRTTYYI